MTDRYAALGYPMGHSLSPRIHARFAAATRQDLVYDAIEVTPGGFAAAVDAFRAGGGRGVNVTVPYKLEAHAYATELTERARVAGAVNCIRFEGRRAIGENFDGVGLVRDIEDNLGYTIRGRRVLLLGAGGAARGALLPLLQCGPSSFTLVNRTVARAEALRTWFAAYRDFPAAGYDALGDARFDLVINATSASVRGELPPVPVSVFAPGCLAYELFYGRGTTPFLRRARDGGATRLADGIGMLVEQAAEAFQWWRGVRPETAPVIRALAVPLEA